MYQYKACLAKNVALKYANTSLTKTDIARELSKVVPTSIYNINEFIHRAIFWSLLDNETINKIAKKEKYTNRFKRDLAYTLSDKYELEKCIVLHSKILEYIAFLDGTYDSNTGHLVIDEYNSIIRNSRFKELEKELTDELGYFSQKSIRKGHVKNIERKIAVFERKYKLVN
ncbi:MAG: hypothetical protein IJ809_02995 [Clostridia bacterium]|nr:hypothetical protein [Clostridia bacterium]